MRSQGRRSFRLVRADVRPVARVDDERALRVVAQVSDEAGVLERVHQEGAALVAEPDGRDADVAFLGDRGDPGDERLAKQVLEVVLIQWR